MDIQSIMKKNVEEVLNWGGNLENDRDMSEDLVSKSKEFKWGAKKVTWQANGNTPPPPPSLFCSLLLFAGKDV
eukprot:8535506-Ditylum_brightwellii.AAC.1